MARYVGQLIAPAEGFCQGKGYFLALQSKTRMYTTGLPLGAKFPYRLTRKTLFLHCYDLNPLQIRESLFLGLNTGIARKGGVGGSTLAQLF